MMYDVVETDWLSVAEILLTLTDTRSAKARTALSRSTLQSATNSSSCIPALADLPLTGLKTFSSEDFKGLTAFIKKRHEIISRKKQLRKAIAKLKLQYTAQELIIKSENIRTALENSETFQKAAVIFCYWSMPDEVDTHQLITGNYPDKRFILPVLAGNELLLKEYNGREEMRPDPVYGILEPSGQPFKDYQAIDLALIPGIAFDEKLNRLGRGKGYYDRILKLLPETVTLWGLGFDFQKTECVPTEDHDHKMDIVFYS